MPGFNPQQLNSRALSGNQVAVLMGDQIFAFAQTVTHSLEMGTSAQYGIGSALPQEIQQLRVQPQITITAFALTAFGLSVAGQNSGIIAVLANNQFNFTIHDAQGNILYVYVGGVCSNFNENIPTNQIVTDTLSFLCLDVYDDSNQSVLNVGGALGSSSGGGAQVGASGLGVNVRANSNGVSVAAQGGFNLGGIDVSGSGSFG